jgi:hypothetical protein
MAFVVKQVCDYLKRRDPAGEIYFRLHIGEHMLTIPITGMTSAGNVVLTGNISKEQEQAILHGEKKTTSTH